MRDPHLCGLIDNDLAPLLSRYEALASIMRIDSIDHDNVLPFLDDLNERFTGVLLRLDMASQSSQEGQP